MPYLTYSMLLYLPLHYNEINLVDCMGLEPMSDQECDGAHSIMLLWLLTMHVTAPATTQNLVESSGIEPLPGLSFKPLSPVCDSHFP